MRSGKILATNDDLIKQFITDPNYLILQDGTILSRIDLTGKVYVNPKEMRIAGTKDKNGYVQISYKGKKLSAHRIIYAMFLSGVNGNPELSQDLNINHKDGYPFNNNVANLELVTQSQNNIHRFRDLKRGAVIVFHKINWDIVRLIRQDRESLGMTLKELGLKYGLAKSSISGIVNYKTWIPDHNYQALT